MDRISARQSQRNKRNCFKKLMNFFHQRARRNSDQAEWEHRSASRASGRERVNLQTPDSLYRRKLLICRAWAPPKIRDLFENLSTEQPDPKIFSLNEESLVLTSFYPTTDLFGGEIKPKRFHGMLWSSFWSENILVLCCLSEHHRIYIPGLKQKPMILPGSEINGKGVGYIIPV